MRRAVVLLVFFVVCGLAFAWHAAGGIGQGGGGATTCVTGDTNGDGQLNISDPVHLLNFLFLGGSEPVPCQAQGTIPASQVSFDPSPSTLEALNVQSAIVELDGRVHGLSTVDSALTTRVAALEGSVEIDLVPIPPGSFTMGSPVTERDRNTNETLHGVILTKSISMGATEVTQAQFRAVMGWNPSAFAGCSDCPVENVNWYDAREFCLRLTDRHRAEGTIAKSAFYRLPTESEWEYACRAGTGTRFFFGDALECGNSQSDFCALANQYMWWSGNQSATAYGPQPVAGKQANPWGLYDMNGNVWEMCSDQFGDYPQGEVTDPQGSAPSLPGIRDRAFRGGSWSATLNGCRSAMRFGYDALDRHGLGGSGTVGFRVVLEVPQ